MTRQGVRIAVEGIFGHDMGVARVFPHATTKATGAARRNNLFSSSNVIMAGSRRVQTAERVHYYFSRKCMVWTNGWSEGLYREKERERERDEERGMEPRGMETHTCTVVNIVPDRYESQCAVYQTAILPTLDTLVVPEGGGP